MIWILATLTSVSLGCVFWWWYRQPANALVRQAESLFWVPAEIDEDMSGGDDTFHSRGPYLVRLVRQSGMLIMMKPPLEQPFNSFIEVELWIREKERDERRNPFRNAMPSAPPPSE